MAAATGGGHRASHGGVLLRRPRLEKRLDEAFGRQLTTVVADAGYGKSTLVDSWSAELQSARHSVTTQDPGILDLFRSLLHALAPFARDVTNQLGAVSSSGAATSKDSRWHAHSLGSALAEQLARALEHDVILVIDDAHLLPENGAAARLLETLCRQAPDLLHMVLVSRKPPPFAIERLRGQGQVLEIEAEDLAFDRNEVAGLAEHFLGGAAVAEELLEITHGWPAAVRMAIERLRGTEQRLWPGELAAMRRPGGSLFTYLAEEVFGQEPAHVRELMRVVAPLDRFTAELASSLNIERAAETITQLSLRGLLLRAQQDAGGWFELHALIREFVRDEWPLTRDEETYVHAQAARWLDENGYLPNAMAEGMAAGHAGWLSSFLARRGRQLLTLDVRSVIAACESLSSEDRNEEIDVVLAEALHVTGDVSASLEILERLAGDRQTIPPRVATWLGLGLSAGFNRPADSIEFFRRGEIEDARTADESLLLSWWARAHCRLGEPRKAAPLARRSLEAARASQDLVATAHARTALGFVALVEGDETRAEAETIHAISVGERARDARAEAGARINLAELWISQGRYLEAIDLLDPAIQLAEIHYPLGNIAPAARCSRALALAHVGQLEEALADAERSLAELRSWSQGALLALPLSVLGDIHRLRGHAVLARAAYEEALSLAERGSDSQTLVRVLGGLARMLALTDPERATALACRAVEESGALERPVALITAGWVALAVEDFPKAMTYAAEAAEGARLPESASALELQAVASDDASGHKSRLQRAISVWEALGAVPSVIGCELTLARSEGDELAAKRAERRLRRIGVKLEGASEAAGLLASISHVEPEGIRVRTLGGFHVVRDGAIVKTSEWQSKKARDLLRMLVIRRGRPTPRDVLTDALWPGIDRPDVSNRFSVALSTLRSVLDPERVHGADHYVRADLGAVFLSNVSVDVDEFLEEASAGLAGDLERLEDAEALYEGDFLEDDPYQDWAVPLREEARSLYILVARALAEAAVRVGDRESCVRLLRRILERDAYDERAHLALVSTLQDARQHGEARRAYAQYTRLMGELGVESLPYPAVGRP